MTRLCFVPSVFFSLCLLGIASGARAPLAIADQSDDLNSPPKRPDRTLVVCGVWESIRVNQALITQWKKRKPQCETDLILGEGEGLVRVLMKGQRTMGDAAVKLFLES